MFLCDNRSECIRRCEIDRGGGCIQAIVVYIITAAAAVIVVVACGNGGGSSSSSSRSSNTHTYTASVLFPAKHIPQRKRLPLCGVSLLRPKGQRRSTPTNAATRDRRGSRIHHEDGDVTGRGQGEGETESRREIMMGNGEELERGAIRSVSESICGRRRLR